MEGIRGGGMLEGWGSGRVEGEKIEKKSTADSRTGRLGRGSPSAAGSSLVMALACFFRF